LRQNIPLLRENLRSIATKYPSLLRENLRSIATKYPPLLRENLRSIVTKYPPLLGYQQQVFKKVYFRNSRPTKPALNDKKMLFRTLAFKLGPQEIGILSDKCG
jgi:hypothetical protein